VGVVGRVDHVLAPPKRATRNVKTRFALVELRGAASYLKGQKHCFNVRFSYGFLWVVAGFGVRHAKPDCNLVVTLRELDRNRYCVESRGYRCLKL
jgi:hypothetical protein